MCARKILIYFDKDSGYIFIRYILYLSPDKAIRYNQWSFKPIPYSRFAVGRRNSTAGRIGHVAYPRLSSYDLLQNEKWTCTKQPYTLHSE